jgi:D-beta-D-heptose 7-phosphate kinase/D-beta-D-heptose 1-phosphate adenosyltransferase
MKELSFARARVLVVGDVMLDRYAFGDVTRISPEAPVPVVRITRETSSLGGAANVANNVAHLGAEVCLIGLCGQDPARELVESLARDLGISTALVADSSVQTTTKWRILGGHQQMLRLDFEQPRTPCPESIRELKDAITRHLAKSHVVVISDYAKGVCGDEVCRFTIDKAAAANVPVIIDPKAEDWSKYARATFVTPNHKELCQAVGRTLDNEDSIVAAHARGLVKKYQIKHLLVTRSEKGISLVTGRDAVHIHSQAQEVYDVSGAGDTVVGAFAAALASGLPMRLSLDLANTAAGIVVGKLGTVPVELDELRQRVEELGLFAAGANLGKRQTRG